MDLKHDARRQQILRKVVGTMVKEGQGRAAQEKWQAARKNGGNEVIIFPKRLSNKKRATHEHFPVGHPVSRPSLGCRVLSVN